MYTLLNLFGGSPFTPLKQHLNCTEECVRSLTALFASLEKGRREEVEQIAEGISTKEHEADLIKNEMRSQLSKSLVLPIKRESLLEFLSILDRIADKAEDAAVLATIRPLHLLPQFQELFHRFLEKNLSTFSEVALVMRELHELIESSFGGIEAEKVRQMVEEVADREHEVDLIQRQLLKQFFTCEDQLSYGEFGLWQKIFETIGEISNLSENLAYRVRATLELQ